LLRARFRIQDIKGARLDPSHGIRQSHTAVPQDGGNGAVGALQFFHRLERVVLRKGKTDHHRVDLRALDVLQSFGNTGGALQLKSTDFSGARGCGQITFRCNPQNTG